MKPSYYNEINPQAAAWLRELIKKGHIKYGEVDERSISDVAPADLKGFGRCHFFSGIGTWGYSIVNAGWPDDLEIWTGSCPCQPFSSAGKRGGFADERHLWPHFHWLISQCRPAVVVGEQVASKDGLAWLDLVQTDMEATGYAFGAVDFCAAGVGAPHIRQRLWWVGKRLAITAGEGLEGRSGPERGLVGPDGQTPPRSDAGRLADTEAAGSSHGRTGPVQPQSAESCRSDSGLADADEQQWDRSGNAGPIGRGELADNRAVGWLADAILAERPDGQPGERDVDAARGRDESATAIAGLRSNHRPGPVNGHWRAADWLYCRDGKWRPVEPGTFPLAHGVAARVGRLRGYGNAVNAKAAQAFIEAIMENDHE